VAATPTRDACPLCGQPLHATRVRAFDRLVTGEGPFTVLECRTCRYGVTDPQFRGAELDHFYGTLYAEAFYEHSTTAQGGLLERARERFRRVAARRRYAGRPYAVAGLAPGRVLDVGCGGGELLAHYAALGWHTFGIDPAEPAAAAARRRGAAVHQGTLSDQPWPAESFELITFAHSLEHIPDPLDALHAARALLAPGGLIAITLPNWGCWQRRFLFSNRWFHLDLPRHLQHFTTDALALTAQALDLDVVEIGTDSTIISVAYSLHYVIAGRWTPGWKLWLSYALGVIAYPPVAAVNALAGGDCCYALLRRPAKEAATAAVTL
jgi:2-polyprenyl-3-methyl-5-hydroxy-6-metoxy-1,4-benzoquinol methylase